MFAEKINLLIVVNIARKISSFLQEYCCLSWMDPIMKRCVPFGWKRRHTWERAYMGRRDLEIQNNRLAFTAAAIWTIPCDFRHTPINPHLLPTLLHSFSYPRDILFVFVRKYIIQSINEVIIMTRCLSWPSKQLQFEKA
jgi:hypothetical protein